MKQETLNEVKELEQQLFKAMYKISDRIEEEIILGRKDEVKEVWNALMRIREEDKKIYEFIKEQETITGR